MAADHGNGGPAGWVPLQTRRSKRRSVQSTMAAGFDDATFSHMGPEAPSSFPIPSYAAEGSNHSQHVLVAGTQAFLPPISTTGANPALEIQDCDLLSSPMQRQSSTSAYTNLLGNSPSTGFRHRPDGQPWTPYNLLPDPQSAKQFDPGFRYDQQMSYREPAQSEVESIVSGGTRSDSGYISRSHPTRSVHSLDVPAPSARDLSLSQQVRDLSPFLQRQRALSQSNIRPSKRRRVRYQDGTSQLSVASFDCGECEASYKCQSELNKHKNRHEKPYKCSVPGCPKAEDGFSTPNDLDRHRASVHRDQSEAKTWRCLSLRCKRRGKPFARLDNFRSHVTRMHRDEDIPDLLERSEIDAEQRMDVSVLIPKNFGSAPQRPSSSVLAQSDLMPAETAPDPPILLDGHTLIQHPPVPLWPSASELTTDSQAMAVSSLMEPNFTADTHLMSESTTKQSRDALTLATTTTDMEEPIETDFNFGFDNLDEVSVQQWNAPAVDELEARKRDADRHLLNVVEQTKRTFLDSIRTLRKELQACTALREELSEPDNPHDALSSRRVERPQTAPRSRIWPQNGEDAKGTVAQALETLPEVEPLIHQLLQQELDAFGMELRAGSDETGHSLEICHKDPDAATNLQCDQCSRILPTIRDLRKHRKRHFLRYMCTFFDCMRRFSTKTEWKRHEQSKHCQTEMWCCDEDETLNEGAKQCGTVYREAAGFMDHLREQHGIQNNDTIDDRTRRCRISAHLQGQYWCGFCKAIVALDSKGEKAWDERVVHISEHINKAGRTAEEWVHLDVPASGGDARMISPTAIRDDMADADLEVGPPMSDGSVLATSGQAMRWWSGDEHSSDDHISEPRSSSDETISLAPAADNVPSSELETTPTKPRGTGKHSRDADEQTSDRAPKAPRPWSVRWVVCCECGDDQKQLVDWQVHQACEDGHRQHEYSDCCTWVEGPDVVSTP